MHVKVQVDINRPLEAVFAYITNFEHNPKWQKGMVSCTFTIELPVAKGVALYSSCTIHGMHH